MGEDFLQIIPHPLGSVPKWKFHLGGACSTAVSLFLSFAVLALLHWLQLVFG
jgi:hypothetical protein